MEKRFNVGDIIVGNENASRYTVTKPGVLCEVVGVSGQEGSGWDIMVTIMDAVNPFDGKPMGPFRVDSRNFDLYRDNIKSVDESEILDLVFGGAT